MEEMVIETAADKFIGLIAEKKKLTIPQAAKLMETDEAQIEKWVKILEERGYVQLIYPAFGEPEIMFKSLPKGEVVQIKKEFKEKTKEVEKKAKDFEEKVTNVEEKIKKTDKYFVALENELHNKLKELDKNLKDLDKLESRKEEVVKKAEDIKKVADTVSSSVETIKSDINKMEEKINDQIKTLEDHENEIKNLDEDKKTIENEIMKLEEEMKMMKLIAKGKSIETPMTNLKKLFGRNKEKTKEIAEKRQEMHKKTLKLKETLKQKSDHVESKKKFLKFLR